jgi:hypothetical protein
LKRLIKLIKEGSHKLLKEQMKEGSSLLTLWMSEGQERGILRNFGSRNLINERTSSSRDMNYQVHKEEDTNWISNID